MDLAIQNINEVLERELKTLHGVLEYIGNRNKRELQFYRTKKILHRLKNEPSFKANDLIRQTHNFYGWMAKNHSRGRCAGALYRTLGFMNIRPNCRDGSQKNSRNIHIEHTIPVNVLESTLRASAQSLHCPRDMHRFMIENSICVAFSHEEEKWLSPAKVPPSKNEAFDLQGKKLNQYPFRRYLPLLSYAEKEEKEFRVYNIITKKEISIMDFTFADHAASIDMVSQLASNSESTFLYGVDGFDQK